jgi:uncharacterized protein
MSLQIDVARIPPEGLDLDEALDAASVHLDDESEFQLRPGARLRCHVELVDGTSVHVRGPLAGTIAPECGRCLEPYSLPVDQELDLFYLPRNDQQPDEQEEEVELSDRDVVVGYYDGGRLDLAEVVREQLFLSLPLRRLCREDCRGLCPTCGKNLNAVDCGCPPLEEPEDPRLSSLRRLIEER